MLDRPTQDQSSAENVLARAREIDAQIARKLRAARLAADVTQEQMAAALGITFQQVQKYEKGGNRISAGRLKLYADLVGRDIAWFFGPDAEDFTFVVMTGGLFLSAAGGHTEFVDQARRFTRAQALRATDDTGAVLRHVDEFLDDAWKSRDALIAELGALRGEATGLDRRAAARQSAAKLMEAALG